MPERSHNPKLAGATALRKSCWNCFASTLPTRRRKVQPAATPLTLPLFFRSAVRRDIRMASMMVCGTSP